MLATGNAAALVASATETPMQATTKRVEVLRAFFYRGVSQKVGSTLDLAPQFAAELAAANKVRIVVAAPAEPAPAKQPEKPRGGKDAG